MKRKMNFERENDFPPNDSFSNVLTIIEKRHKPDGITLVNDSGKLAEKVEPGYLIKLAEEIEKANNFVFHNACGKLKLIEEQMGALKNQAYRILSETKINSCLHSLPCNLNKKPGQIYSVYEKLTGECYFSMLTPQEWGNSCPHKFIGSFKLEYNMMWTPVDDFSRNSAYRRWISLNEDAMMID